MSARSLALGVLLFFVDPRDRVDVAQRRPIATTAVSRVRETCLLLVLDSPCARA